MTSFLRTAALVALAAWPVMARADDMTMHMSAGTPADKAFMRSMTTMKKDMAVKPTGDTDKDFVAMMLPHHQGAVDMARIELQYGKDPVLRAMATDIVASQEKEIATMKAWQARNGR